MKKTYPFKIKKKPVKYTKPKPVIGDRYKFSNKKHNNIHSGQTCIVLNVAEGTTNHNALIQCKDGYLTVTSKWNLFDL